MIVDGDGIVRHTGHPLEPAFEAAVATWAGKLAPPARVALPLITASADDLKAMRVADLKVASWPVGSPHASHRPATICQAILQERGLSIAGLAEKADLVDAIRKQCTSTTYYQK